MTLTPGEITELAPGVRRIVAPNPGLMTGPGTNTYLVGDAEIAVLDPGPAIESHVECLLAAAGAPITRILVTHTHRDHSPGARLLAAETGAEILGRRAPAGAHQDERFAPDREPRDGDTLVCGGVELEVLHTPGHASNHLCYLDAGRGWLFTGDHIINGSTVVIDPPDGSMCDYLASLARLREERLAIIAPGHGELIDRPREAIDWLIAHRGEREAKVLDRLGANPGTMLTELVGYVYDEVDPRLHGVAERSLLAHLLKLAGEGRARETDGRWTLTA